jgi:metal-responsive CopG/Arc/MetJ family transcriptional regulator
MKKIAITLTAEQLEAIERIRRRRGVPRSRVIQEAVGRFLEAQGLLSSARDYEAGYRRFPEGQEEARAFAAATAAALASEDWE